VLQSFEVRAPADFEGAFAAIREQRPDALLTLGDPLTVTMRTALADFALKERLPAMFTHRQFVEVGGLASYGANFPDLFRRAAWYVDKILKGANPGGLPVQQPVKFELFLNLTTANALGLTIPPSVLQPRIRSSSETKRLARSAGAQAPYALIEASSSMRRPPRTRAASSSGS
jgi:putative ABC transport system substrate-binding protein